MDHQSTEQEIAEFNTYQRRMGRSFRIIAICYLLAFVGYVLWVALHTAMPDTVPPLPVQLSRPESGILGY